MADRKLAYGTVTTITLTLTSLAATAARESTAVDNTTNKFLDALVAIKVKVDVTAPTNDKALYVYAYGTVDATTPVYPDPVTGTDAAITLTAPTGLRLIGILPALAASTVYESSPFSVAAAFGGYLPPKWGIVVANSSAVLTAVGGDHDAEYVGIYETLV